MRNLKLVAVLICIAVSNEAVLAKTPPDTSTKDSMANLITRVEGYLAKYNETYSSVRDKGAELRFGVGGKAFSVYAWDDKVMGFPAPTLDTLPPIAEASEYVGTAKQKEVKEKYIKKADYPQDLILAENKAALFFVSEGITSATNGSPVSVEAIKSLYESWDALDAPLGDEKCATYLRLVSWIELLGGSREFIVYRPLKGK